MDRLSSFRVFWLYGLPGFLLIALSSCSSTPAKSAAKPAATPLYPEEVASALMTDEVLAQQLEIQDQSFTRDTDRVVLAQGFIYNKTAQPIQVQVRILFKSTQGETLESSPWKRLTLPPKTRVAQAAPTINPFVTRYLLEIRKVP